MSGEGYGQRGPSEFRNAGDAARRQEQVRLGEQMRQNEEAVAELEEHGTVKPPWYRRLFWRHPRDPG